MTACRHVLILLLLLGSTALEEKQFMTVAEAGEQLPKEVLAAQIRSQGVVCEKPTRAVRDAKRSRPDYDVWVLTCKNATYRISRYPDMTAKVVQLR